MIRDNEGTVKYIGAVLREEEHMWADGMLEVWAVVWDTEEHKEKQIPVGYYGSDCCNLHGGEWSVDEIIAPEVAADMLKTKKAAAVAEFCKSVATKKAAIEKGVIAEVIRGRKVKKGTRLEVFWVGERETYRSRQYAWMNETETVAGCFDEAGNKVWIKAEYLKNITPIKSPKAKERKKFINAWMRHNIPDKVFRAVR